MKKRSVITFVMLSLATALQAETSQKDIAIVTAAQAGTSQVGQSNAEETYFGTQRGQLFSFIEPAVDTVGVGEPITVALKLKEKAYVYLIAVSNKSNQAYMILPNRFEGNNLYGAQRHYVIPQRSAEYQFVSDAVGVETLYVVASTHKQSFDQLLEKFGTKELGGFRVSTAKSAQSFMKDILVVPATSNKAKVEVRKLHINVDGEHHSALSDVRVFLSSGKTIYQQNDIVSIKYQTDKQGYVYLVVINPDKSVSLIHSSRVEKNKSYTLEQEAVGSGKHLLLAYFSREKLTTPAKTLDTKELGKRNATELHANNQHMIIIK